MNRILILFFTTVALFLTACGDKQTDTEEQQADKTHIWQHQTGTLHNARDAANQIQQGIEREQKAMEEAGR